jgi:hypothetical protein
MVVGRYVVDAILIGGLIVGTLGVFFLSNGLFGHVGNRILRWLLIMVPILVFAGVATAQMLIDQTDPSLDSKYPYLGFMVDPRVVIPFMALALLGVSQVVYGSIREAKPPTLKLSRVTGQAEP